MKNKNERRENYEYHTIKKRDVGITQQKNCVHNEWNC